MMWCCTSGFPCPHCAHEMSTPWIPDNRTGVSLHRDLENFLEQSAQVRGESEEESENDEVIEDQAARVRRYQNASLGEVSDPEFWQAVNHFEGSESD